MDCVQSLEAKLGTVTSAQDAAMADTETWRGRFDSFFPITARLGAGGNGGVRGSFSKSHLEQHQHSLFTGGFKLETANLFPCKEEHWVRQGAVAMGTTESDKHIDLAWRFIDPEA